MENYYWKSILEVGMIHVNGKGYPFAKCTGYGLYYSQHGSPIDVYIQRIGIVKTTSLLF